ncbi:MAG TPA: SRPBCC family protein [Frankiaceae bacterium]|nr:SRPBCC family protein [Frankiaceae bacterium]
MAASDNGRLDGLTRFLGWSSLGLGVAQLAAPHRVARLAGVDDSATAPLVIRAVGGRELIHAAGLLGSDRHRAWAKTRVAGDALDLAVLAYALNGRDGDRRRRAKAATAAVAGIAALDVYAAIRASKVRGDTKRQSLHASVTINRPPAEVYAFWRDFTNLPAFMAHLESVETLGGFRSRWTAKAPAGRTVTWEAELVDDSPNRLVAWRSLPGATVPNSGRVRFVEAPGGRGTEVHVEMEYEIPAGKLGAVVARLFGEEPEQQVRDDLRRCKQVLETGDVVVSDGTPDGIKARRTLAQRPARPETVGSAR